MLDKTKTRISDLLRKSVGLPASDSSCCALPAQSPVGSDARPGVDPSSTEGTEQSCCGSRAKLDDARAPGLEKEHIDVEP